MHIKTTENRSRDSLGHCQCFLQSSQRYCEIKISNIIISANKSRIVLGNQYFKLQLIMNIKEGMQNCLTDCTGSLDPSSN